MDIKSEFENFFAFFKTNEQNIYLFTNFINIFFWNSHKNKINTLQYSSLVKAEKKDEEKKLEECGRKLIKSGCDGVVSIHKVYN